MKTHTALRRHHNGGFTLIEMIVVVTVIGLLAAIAVGAYNRTVLDAKQAKSAALLSTLVTAKSLFAADPATTPAMVSDYNQAPDASFASLAKYIRISGAQPIDETDLLAKSGMSSAKISLGTVDDGQTTVDVAPTVTGY